MMKVLIVDDHAAVRIGLKHILANEFPQVRFGEASNFADLVQSLAESSWNLVILDISLPGRNGLDILKQIKDTADAPVLVYSFHEEEQFAIRALRAGASGYLSKAAPDKEILNAIYQILNGRKYITMAVAEMMASQMSGSSVLEPHQRLSDREFQTLLLIAKGKTVSQIALDLSLGITTVSTYRTRILEKMNMRTNAELTRYVIENRLNA